MIWPQPHPIPVNCGLSEGRTLLWSTLHTWVLAHSMAYSRYSINTCWMCEFDSGYCLCIGPCWPQGTSLALSLWNDGLGLRTEFLVLWPAGLWLVICSCNVMLAKYRIGQSLEGNQAERCRVSKAKEADTARAGNTEVWCEVRVKQCETPGGELGCGGMWEGPEADNGATGDFKRDIGTALRKGQRSKVKKQNNNNFWASINILWPTLSSETKTMIQTVIVPGCMEFIVYV